MKTLARSIAALAIGCAALHVHAQKPPEAWKHLESADFKSSYRAALGPKAKTPWLAKRDGPAPEPSLSLIHI